MLTIRNLSVLNYANGFTFWHYRTKDTLNDCFIECYFNDAKDMIAVGDMIAISASDGEAVRYVTEYLSPVDPFNVSLALEELK